MHRREVRESTVISYGVRIGLRAGDPETLEHLVARLPPGTEVATSPSAERWYSLLEDGSERRALSVDGHPLAHGRDLERLGDAFESDVQLFVAEMAPERVFVHAGVVGWREVAILVPGRSLSGKTTLVTELVRAGASYYSDEYAVLDERGEVHPYARPLSIRQGGDRPRRCSAEALGGRRGIRPLPVGLVVITEYRAGAAWEPRLLSAGEGALALLAHTVSARRQPAAALGAVREVVVSGIVLEGPRGEASAAAGAILETL
jgi:hypothetical protein